MHDRLRHQITSWCLTTDLDVPVCTPSSCPEHESWVTWKQLQSSGTWSFPAKVCALVLGHLWHAKFLLVAISVTLDLVSACWCLMLSSLVVCNVYSRPTVGLQELSTCDSSHNLGRSALLAPTKELQCFEVHCLNRPQRGLVYTHTQHFSKAKNGMCLMQTERYRRQLIRNPRNYAVSTSCVS